jgi:uncharacterized protein
MQRLKQVLAVAGVLAATGCATVQGPPIEFPAIVSPPTQEHHTGKVIFVELVTPDLAAAKAFYGEVFGWTFKDFQGHSIEYAEASLNGHPVAGLFHKDYPDGKKRPIAWLTYLSVPDVDTAAKTASGLGAKVLFEPHSIPNRGQEAVFSDPQGAIFAILASTSGDPPDVLAGNGDWIWSSLITSDAKSDADFYKAVFGYDVFELPAAAGAQHLMLASDNYARASVNTHAVQRPDSHSYWLNYIRVVDAAKTAAKVVALGGQILVEPRVDRHGGTVAVVADPLGAPFGLLEWQDTETKAVTK